MWGGQRTGREEGKTAREGKGREKSAQLLQFFKCRLLFVSTFYLLAQAITLKLACIGQREHWKYGHPAHVHATLPTFSPTHPYPESHVRNLKAEITTDGIVTQAHINKVKSK